MANISKDPSDAPASQSSESYFSSTIQTRFGTTINDLLQVSPSGPESNISYHPASQQPAPQPELENLQYQNTELPPGWPKQVTGIHAWEPDQLSESLTFVFHITAVHMFEIYRALQVVIDQNLSFDEITKAVFPLQELGGLLLQIRDIVYAGIGFAILRGLDLRQFNYEERAIVFLGISSYIGDERGPQDRYGTMMKHIMDDERTESLKELPFHTDVTCDASALLTVKSSDHGGEWTVASSSSVYNDLASRRPDLIGVLAKPDWPFDTFGRTPAYYCRAPLHLVDGKPIFNFSRRLLVGHPKFGRTPGVPKLNEAQAEALDAVHSAAREHYLKFAMQEGDVRFVSNLGLLHGREGFRDNDNDESRRHVIRLWLRNRELTLKLPPALELAWARIFDDPERLREWIVQPYKDENGVVHGRGRRTECD